MWLKLIGFVPSFDVIAERHKNLQATNKFTNEVRENQNIFLKVYIHELYLDRGAGSGG